MAVKCAWASIDERGRASGGAAGDQTGGELKTGPWYYFGQTVVLRFKDASLGAKAANIITKIVNNPKVGYDQYQRTTLFTEMQRVGWNPDKIVNKCETDCSALIAVVLNAIGIKVSKDIWTGNTQSALMATGKFTTLTSASYTKTDLNLRTGDILLNTQRHVIMAVQNGANIPVVNGVIGRGVMKQTMPVRNSADVRIAPIGKVKRGTKVACYKTKKDKYGRTFWALDITQKRWVVYQDKKHTYINRTH